MTTQPPEEDPVTQPLLLVERAKLALTPARVETLKTDLLALAAFIAAISASLPAAWMNGALALGALATKLAGTLSFLKGNREWEQSPAGQAQLAPAAHDLPPGQDPHAGPDADEGMGADDEPLGEDLDATLSAGGELPADDEEAEVPPPDELDEEPDAPAVVQPSQRDDEPQP